jgi:hypothetical protein
VTGKTTAGFWACFDRLSREVQTAARKKYRLWQRDPFHPSLHFKEVVPDLWSVRVNLQYRAPGRRRGELVVWFWIGTHEEYDGLIGRA